MKNNRFLISNNTKKLIVCVNEVSINYPRKYFVLRDRIVNDCYKLLELIYLANTMEDRIDIQKKMVAKICMIDTYFEISYKNKCISFKKYNYLSRELNIIRKMVYGWIKSGNKI